jgi:hypothetical protein
MEVDKVLMLDPRLDVPSKAA